MDSNCKVFGDAIMMRDPKVDVKILYLLVDFISNRFDTCLLYKGSKNLVSHRSRNDFSVVIHHQ